MPCPVHNIKNTHCIGLLPVENQIITEPSHRQHLHVFHARIMRGIKNAAPGLGCDVLQRFCHRLKHALGGIRIITRNMRVNARQVVCNNRRMPLDPHTPLRLTAAPRTRSFHPGSSGANGPCIRSINTHSNVPAAQSDFTRLSRYSSFERAPDAFILSVNVAYRGSGKLMVSVDMA